MNIGFINFDSLGFHLLHSNSCCVLGLVNYWTITRPLLLFSNACKKSQWSFVNGVLRQNCRNRSSSSSYLILVLHTRPSCSSFILILPRLTCRNRSSFSSYLILVLHPSLTCRNFSSSSSYLILVLHPLHPRPSSSSYLSQSQFILFVTHDVIFGILSLFFF